MNVTSLGFRTDLMVRELAGAQLEDRPEAGYAVVRTPDNPGFWWGNFLLYRRPPQPGDAQRWTAHFAAEFPDAGHLAFGVDGTDGEAGDRDELACLGVEVEVNAVLTAGRLAPPAATAPGVDVRPLRSAGDWAQAGELRSALEDGEESSSAQHQLFAERQLAEDRRLCEAGYGAWFGAFVDGRLRASAGLFTDGQGLARYQNVHTHPDFRRRALASHVVYEAGRWGLTQLRVRTLVIVADPEYPAIRLYRALGFSDTERQVQLQRGPESVG